MSKSDQIKQDIEETRHEMDETLEEVEERIQPRHLLDEVLEFFGAGNSADGSSTDKLRKVGKSIVRKAKDHPVPALLCGAGLAWLVFESLEEDEPDRGRYRQWRNLPEHSGSFVDARTGQPYEGRYAVSAAWEESYDWSEEDESTWLKQAKQTMSELQNQLSDKSASTRDKLKGAASRLRKLRGDKYEQACGQWRDLPEHSGSFVDARTGEPYDEATYGRSFHPAEELDFLSDHEWSEDDEKIWSEKGQRTLESLQHALSDGKQSTQRRIQSLASHLSGFASTMQGRASSAAHGLRSGARRAGEATGHYASQAQRRGAEMARQTQQQVSQTVDEYPLAVGAACLGLGLAVGLLLPPSRSEDRWMGEASDDLKDRAEYAGRDALERGKRVAEDTAKAAMDEAERQGLTPKQLGEKVRQGAEHIAETAQEEVGKTRKAGKKVEKVAKRAGQTAEKRSKEEAEAYSN